MTWWMCCSVKRSDGMRVDEVESGKYKAIESMSMVAHRQVMDTCGAARADHFGRFVMPMESF